MENDIICLCPIEGVIDIIAKKWALLVINELGNHGKLRFNELMRELKPITPRALADVLRDLLQVGLISRTKYNEIPPRVEYFLTEDGKKLRNAILPLLRWALEREDTVIAHCSCSLIEQGEIVKDVEYYSK
ncbi:MAG TPA: helix-turn-helix domain-containing protein [Geobacterales bacterium]|nr:helix-turn-helix domain-containing protein [Geobacterales bacterium]